MRQANTKERILNESLKLFSQNGYEAVGVIQIAAAVGIKAPSLYKHYKNKRAIFDSILERVNEMDSDQAQSHEMPNGTVDEVREDYNNVPFDKICEYTRAMFLHWAEEEFSRNFRRLLTLEQYKTREMGELYQQYLSGGPVQYMADIFNAMVGSQSKAYQLAVEFYSPIFLMYSLYDSGADINDLLALLQKHLSDFSERLEESRSCGE